MRNSWQKSDLAQKQEVESKKRPERTYSLTRTGSRKMPAGSVAVPTVIPLKAPSSSKWSIDSATQIELRSATPDSVVFYTLNGSKPDPFQRLGVSHTFSYRAPFTLPSGRVTIKALATSQDGLRQSAIVTKTFSVKEAPESFDLIESVNDNTSIPAPPRLESSLSAQLRCRLKHASWHSTVKDGGALAASRPAVSPPPGHTNSFPCTTPIPAVPRPFSTPARPSSTPARLLTAREKPKPMCVYCSAPRSKDPQYKYCTHCGSRLPPLPSTDEKLPLRMSVCPSCRAHMPPEAIVCLVCETPVINPSPLPTIQSQIQPQNGGKKLKVKDELTCLSCGTLNPPCTHTCVTCEASIPPPPPSPLPSPPPSPPPLPTPATIHPINGSSYLLCGACGRVNVSDARFCDWCGGMPQSSQLSVACPSCSSPSHWHARHCSSCGAFIKAPLRKGVELGSTMKMPVGLEVPKNAWVPVVDLEHKGPAVTSRTTQTQGLFYPSACAITKKKEAELVRQALKTTSRDRLVKLDTWSTGKGLWRSQVEHVCAHLRAYTQSCPGFQTAIGTPLMGKLLKADIDNDEDEEKASIHLTFSLKKDKEKNGASLSTPMVGSKILSKHSSQSASAASLGSSKELKGVSRKSRRNLIPKQSAVTQQLMKELSQKGLGRKDTVKELIQKGADVNAVDSSGLPLLSATVAYCHLDCIDTLVEGGAAVNAQTKSTGNTALHECVLRGPSRTDYVEALLGHGADARIKNKDGLTPCELAVKLGHNSIVTCFAAYVGASLLDQLCRVQPNLTL